MDGMFGKYMRLHKCSPVHPMVYPKILLSREIGMNFPEIQTT